jgi:hypothetical protein
MNKKQRYGNYDEDGWKRGGVGALLFFSSNFKNY